MTIPLRLPAGLPALILTAAVAAACSPDTPDVDTPTPDVALATPDAGEVAIRDAFFQNLAAHCGQAFPGGLTLEPPGDEMLQGDELLVVHVRGCSEDELQLPFHIEGLDGAWDRSRTWIFRKQPDGSLELRHDHRKPDGTEDEVTWYGAFTVAAGTPNRQEFIRDREYDDGSTRGWRVEVEPGQRYTYGTIRNGEWTWRVDFDLSAPLGEPPPPPWGYEGGQGPLR
jgi:hypothetical protein